VPRRVRLVALLLCVAFALLGVRLWGLQIVRAARYREQADRQHLGKEPVPARRGDILAANGTIIARSVLSTGVFVDAALVSDAATVVDTLSRLLDLSESARENLLKRIRRRERFIWVSRSISPRRKTILEELDLKGVHFLPVWRRVYPLARSLCDVTGFCSVDGEGLAGLELAFDKRLRGRDGERSFHRDALGKRIHIESGWTPPRDGDTLVTTVDPVIQQIADRAIEAAFEEHKPDRAAAVVLDPRTGAVLAIASRPGYDPNHFNRYPAAARVNPVTGVVFEPGSTFKAITASALLEERLVDVEEEIFCHNGACAFGRRILHDHRGHGVLPFRMVIAKSSNIGAARCAERLSPERHHHYIDAFGFGARTGIETPGEEAGVLRPVERWSKYSQVSLAIGQEVGVTALQMVRAFAAIANGGYLVRPYLVERIESPDGAVVFETRPRRRRVISTETSRTMREILSLVVEEGTARRARSRYYQIAGKTGTAQKLDRATGRYSDENYIASFIGFAPADAPRLVVGVFVDTPRGRTHFGGTVAAPVVKRIMEQALMYLEVPQFEEESDESP